uniref:Uncharacterized protein n=1 Tax=Arundo donax TaxID=35708 RepID=A0A0A9HJQ6_ARUDO
MNSLSDIFSDHELSSLPVSCPENFAWFFSEFGLN